MDPKKKEIPIWKPPLLWGPSTEGMFWKGVPAIPNLRDLWLDHQVAVLENNCGVKNYIDRIVPTVVGEPQGKPWFSKEKREPGVVKTAWPFFVVVEKVAVEIFVGCVC